MPFYHRLPKRTFSAPSATDALAVQAEAPSARASQSGRSAVKQFSILPTRQSLPISNAPPPRGLLPGHPVKSKNEKKTQARELLENIINELQGLPISDIKNAPILKHLSQVDFAVKKELTNYILKEQVATQEVICENFNCIFGAMDLGHSPEESALRQQVLADYPKRGGVTALLNLANNINDFKPSVTEIPQLVAIGEKISKDLGDHFPKYLSLLQGAAESTARKDASPEMVDVQLHLIKSWLLDSPSVKITTSSIDCLEAPYLDVEKGLGKNGLFGVRSTKIPSFMRRCKERFSSLSSVKAAKSATTWLGYSAAHLLGKDFSPRDQRALEGIYTKLILNNYDYVSLYGASQIIGKALQSPKGDHLIATVSKFDDAMLGVLIYGASGGDVALSSRFAKLLNGGRESDQTINAVVNDLLVFSGSDALETQAKQRLFKIVAEEIFKEEFPVLAWFAMRPKFEKIGKIIATESCSKSEPLYQGGLSKCEKFEDIDRALSPGSSFLGDWANREAREGEAKITVETSPALNDISNGEIQANNKPS